MALVFCARAHQILGLLLVLQGTPGKKRCHRKDTRQKIIIHGKDLTLIIIYKVFVHDLSGHVGIKRDKPDRNKT